MEIRAVPRMNDILPDEAPKWRFVEDKARRIFELYGFGELRPPLLERTELFLRGIGDETDVVEKQMYTFVDKGGDSVTLRPEATACVLRAVIEHGLLNRDPLARLYTIGPMFRYERPQKGRFRQFHQINAERLGEDSPLVDAETLALAYDIVSGVLGEDGLVMDVNSLGCRRCRPAFTSALRGFLSSRRHLLCADCVRRMDTNPLRVLDCKVDSCRDAVKDAPTVEASLCEDCRGHHERVIEGLGVMGVPFALNPNLVRGLDYYTRTTFEIISKGLGSNNAVAGGGRYDELMGLLGGPDVGGIGFAIGVERLVMLAPEGIARREDACFVVAQNTPEAGLAALGLMKELRAMGIPVQAALGKSFKAQMRRADREGCPVCVIVGEEEITNGVVTVRDMRRASQVTVPRPAMAREISGMLEGEKGEQR
jgi:histidyl-tRNA synthetase